MLFNICIAKYLYKRLEQHLLKTKIKTESKLISCLYNFSFLLYCFNFFLSGKIDFVFVRKIKERDKKNVQKIFCYFIYEKQNII